MSINGTPIISVEQHMVAQVLEQEHQAFIDRVHQRINSGRVIPMVSIVNVNAKAHTLGNVSQQQALALFQAAAAMFASVAAHSSTTLPAGG